MNTLFTIGYERAAFADLAATMVSAGVTRVIDVRAQPHSRRREFAFKHLGPGLAEYGIGYESWPALGTPAAGREAAKQGDMEGFAQILEAQMATPEAQGALDDLCRLLETETPCLLCYERDAAHCHRTLIGAHLQRRTDVVIRDLFVDEPSRTDRFTWSPGDITLEKRGGEGESG